MKLERSSPQHINSKLTYIENKGPISKTYVTPPSAELNNHNLYLATYKLTQEAIIRLTDDKRGIKV